VLFLIELLRNTFIETFYITGMIILIGLLLGVMRTYSNKNFQRTFGSNAVMITAFIGVPIHELSHAIIAILFGHKINDIKLLQKPDENGVMGYVNHSYNKNSIYQQIGNFFIGIAPIFGGAISIITLMYFVIPKAYNQFIYILFKNIHVTTLNVTIIEGIISSYGGLIKAIFLLKNFENPFFYVFLFISICISCHMSLSYADLKGAYRGLIVIFLILLLLNILNLSQYMPFIEIMRYNIFLTAIMVVALFLSAIAFILSLILLLMRRNLF